MRLTILLLILLVLKITYLACTHVRKVQPSCGSLAGGTMLTIFGEGFSPDQFTTNDDPRVGDHVFFVTKLGRKISCEVFPQGTTANQIMCSTPQNMLQDVYYVRLIVDGIPVDDTQLCGGEWASRCSYHASSGCTPTITSITPLSGVAGSTVTLSGNIITDRYGSDIETSSNGKTEQLRRAFVGPKDCLMKDGDEFFGPSVSKSGDYGTIRCVTQGTSVGFYNASFLVDAPYGRSLPDPSVYRVSANDAIYMYQVYTDITSVSPSSGSKAGGQTLRINGSFFDDRAPYKLPRAYVGDTECKITKVVVDEYIECTVDAKPENITTVFKGNRGVIFEYWTSTTSSMGTIDDILKFNDSDPGYNKTFLDDTYYLSHDMNNYVSRMTTLFTPPHDGEYSFVLKANTGAKLFVNETEMVVATCCGYRLSARMNLTTTDKYLLVIIHYGNSGSFVEAGAKFFDTNFTEAWTKKAEDEVQKIALKSRVDFDVQELIFDGFSNSSYTKEVQTIKISTDGSYRLGLYGVYTESLAVFDDMTVVEHAFNVLPVFGPDETVTVVKNDNGSAYVSFTLTFQSRRGDFPLVEVINDADGPILNVTVLEDMHGSPDVNMVALTFVGKTSQPFSVISLDAEKLEEILDGLFSAQCPDVITSSKHAFIFENFEANSEIFAGFVTKETEPFCGRYSLKNPDYIFMDSDGLSFPKYSVMCFAYKGLIEDKIWISFSYADTSNDVAESVSTTIEENLAFKRDSNIESHSWYYTCFDMKTSIHELYPYASNMHIHSVKIVRSGWDSNIFVDALFIGKKETVTEFERKEINLRRRPAAMPNGAIIETATVISATNNNYTVTLKPFDCRDQFPLIELTNSKLKSGNASYPSKAATYNLRNSKAGTLSVRRIFEASPPLQGHIDIEFFGNKKTGLNISLSGTDFGSELESLPGIGDLSVLKTASCFSTDLTVRFMSLPGDIPEMNITSARLTGFDVQTTVSTITNGGLYYTPLSGDMLSTVHETAQVRVFINDVPTKCNSDCSFEWSEELTPKIKAITPLSGNMPLRTTVDIFGDGFDSDITKNAVSIGVIPCDIIQATENSIKCNVGVGPSGTHKVSVNVAGKGYATHTDGDVKFIYTANLTSISPNAGGLGGGIPLIITGFGFTADTMVYVGNGICTIMEVTPVNITCILPASKSSGKVNVTVMIDMVNYTYTDFNYDETLTPLVTNVIPTSVGVAGGIVTVSGSNFGDSQGPCPVPVSIGALNGTVMTYNANKIVFEASGLPAGTQPVKICSLNGIALNGTHLPVINVTLNVNNVCPLTGSLLGGSRLTISGIGFGTNKSVVRVDVGAVHCEIESVTDTQIICLIVDTGRIHNVTNHGTHRAFGIYYAFDNSQLTIERGDYVHWSWETPSFVNNIHHAIIQVESRSSRMPLKGGFSSGPPSRNGNFQYQFTQLGTFYVWSGYVDVYGIKNYVGQIEVVEKMSALGEVNVRVAGVEAPHYLGDTTDRADTSKCQSVTSANPECIDSMPSDMDSNKFNFAFWSCATPVIDTLNPNNGTTKTVITIGGKGFSSVNRQNEIRFGDVICRVLSATSTSVSCILEKELEPVIGLTYPVSMRVVNLGKSLVNITSHTNQGFAVVPSLEDISPTVGSLAGGAQLIISGFGYGGHLMVFVGSYSCKITEHSYRSIKCETPSYAFVAELNITVYIMVSGMIHLAVCETTDQLCTYTYSFEKTPRVTSIDKFNMSGATNFTVTGHNFGFTKSEMKIYIGDASAVINSLTDTNMVAFIENVRVGANTVTIRHTQYGKAYSNIIVAGAPVIATITPRSGSIYGETEITISGNGFIVENTTVLMGSKACEISSVSLAKIICKTPALHLSGFVNITVTSNSVSYSPETFEYASESTPIVSGIDPISGLAGCTLTITGSNLEGKNTTVHLGGVLCDIIHSSPSQIKCKTGPHATGRVPVNVFVEGLGASDQKFYFEYNFTVWNITPSKGGVAGGQSVTLSGQGLSEAMTVTICNIPCAIQSTTSEVYVCKTKAHSAKTCNVVIILNGISETLPKSYTYDSNLTSTVTDVTPTRGGTGGGTVLTITGSGFGSNAKDVWVRIDGSECNVKSVRHTELTCETSPHPGSIKAKVEVEISGNGVAEEISNGDISFFYIDRWSSIWTWGGKEPPKQGEFVIIPKGHTILLDSDTPVLKILLIQGGHLFFDEKDIELQANVIMITDGGILEVGTETEPFQHKAVITLHGHLMDKALPIYGNKVLAVRNGTLHLHGRETPLTWTRLAETAFSGNDTIHLVNPVEWNLYDEIVIAATGHQHSQSENEKRKITAVSSDRKTLTLDSPLEFKHLGEEEIFGSTLVEFRAEVGLLTHNVVVRGNRNPAWTDLIETCPAGYNTGEFAVQNCFQGRYGEEMGSKQFGGIVFVHAPKNDINAAEVRLSFIEITIAGQAFQLSRHPIHFHLNGDMSTSYIKGLSIHESFNRGITIQGCHNIKVEKSVLYNIMGAGVYMEDGTETGNCFQYNLAVYVRESSSLSNDDIAPAAFLVTNPNNTIQHNAAAGGTHSGYWYRLLDHTTGPSSISTIHPNTVPLNVFKNNTAHSFGRYGLWIFTRYFPAENGYIKPAVFHGLVAWNNLIGAEALYSGAIQFENFILVQNKLAGYMVQTIINVPKYTKDSPMINNSLIVGTTSVAPDNILGCTDGGITLPHGAGFIVKNVTFVNFASSCSAFKIIRHGNCCFMCGFNYQIEKVTFINSPNKGLFSCRWELILRDCDGSLTNRGHGGSTVLPYSRTLPHDCEKVLNFSLVVLTYVCPSQYKFHRFILQNLVPRSIRGKALIIKNQYGNSSVSYSRRGDVEGWMCALIDGQTYKFEFENAEHITNISFTGIFSDFDEDEYIFIRLHVKRFPDRFSIDGGSTYIEPTLEGLDPTNSSNGDWEWDKENDEIQFIVKSSRESGKSDEIVIRFTAFKCFYIGCITPPERDGVPPKPHISPDFTYWFDATLWNTSFDGYIVNTGGFSGVPRDYDSVRIVYGTWVVVNTTINVLGNLLLEGVLEFYNDPDAVYQINAYNIIIMGGRLIIGWPDEPFLGLAYFILRGNHSSPYYIAEGNGPDIGSKAIGVFGGLDLFGKDVGVTWTKLSVNAMAGVNQIVLVDNVSWVAGDEVVIGASRYDPRETEKFTITAVSEDGMTLKLNDSLKYDHLVYSEIFPNGRYVDVAAPVGLLTRNIKIIGEDYPGLLTERYGARILVGLYQENRYLFHTGYARLSNVEFVHTGQEGFTEFYDARFSVTYIGVGPVSHVKPSIISKCSFHNSFNSAIGAFGIRGLHIINNVLYHTLGSAIVIDSDDTSVMNNMVALVEWTGSNKDKYEIWAAGIEAISAKRLVLKNNIVTASERHGFHVSPLECGDSSGRYDNNMAFSNLIGYGIFPGDSLKVSCAKVSNFIAWKNHDFGLYFQNIPSLEIQNNTLVDNRQGIWTGIVGPPAFQHNIGNKFVEISNNLIIGESPSYDCVKDISPDNDNMALSGYSRPGMAPSGGIIGVTFPNFMSGGNSAPEKKLTGITSYNAIAGLMKIKDITFAHFGTSACKGSFALATNVNNDDAQHPVEAEIITFYYVEKKSKIVYHRPNIGKINPSDCVDMDCDAMKKVLLKDLDGSFLGHIGSVIPQSEFEWGENAIRGLGDYRIPKTMVTNIDGSTISYNEIAPHKGIIRNSNCRYVSAWQAYECGADLNFEMLIVENMDDDTETRRISPVAILGDGYIDLINGPQDHSWCHAHSCRKRLSTFMALVATENEYLLHFTGTTPFHMRYTLLNTDAEAIKLTVWYSRPNRLDVYVSGKLVMATNARINQLGFYILEMPEGDEFTPHITSVTGTNKVDHVRGEHTVIIKGSTPVEVITQKVLIVSFGLPAMTVKQFYGANIVENLAAFLRVPLNKLRVVNIINEKTQSFRTKRNSEETEVAVEIGDAPAQTINERVYSSLDLDAFKALASDIVNVCQIGNLSASLNLTGICVNVEVPSASASDDLIVYNTLRPDHLVLTVAPVPKFENVPLNIQPKIQVINQESIIITDLGTLEHPWQLDVSIRPGSGHPDAILSGSLQVNASKGWFNFTDLIISHAGKAYILEFVVTYPPATNFSISSDPFDISWEFLTAHIVSKANGDIYSSSLFSIELDLRDTETGDIINDIGWSNRIWYTEAAMLGKPTYGNLTGELNSLFNATTGRALYPDLNITGFGFYYIKFRVYSEPPDCDFTFNEKMIIMNPENLAMIPEEEYKIQVKFDVDYDEILPTVDLENEFEQMILSEYANVWPEVRMTSGSMSRGSIILNFVIDGTSEDLSDTAYNLCETITNMTNYTFYEHTLSLDDFMTVNDLPFYGVKCGPIDSASTGGDDISVILIIAIVVAAVLVLSCIVIWLCCIMKMKKRKRPQYHGHNSNHKLGRPFHADTVTNMKFRPSSRTTFEYFEGLSERRPLSGISLSALSVSSIRPSEKTMASPDSTYITRGLFFGHHLGRNLMFKASPNKMQHTKSPAYPHRESTHGGSRVHPVDV